MSKTPISKVLELLGGNPYGRQAYLAKLLGVNRQFVHIMVKAGRVPETQAGAIAALVDNKVTAEELITGRFAKPKKRKAA